MSPAPRRAASSLFLALSLAVLGHAQLWAQNGIVRPVRLTVPRVTGPMGAPGRVAVTGYSFKTNFMGQGLPRLQLSHQAAPMPNSLPLPASVGLADIGPVGEQTPQDFRHTAEIMGAIESLPEGKAREDLRSFINELAAHQINPVAGLSDMPEAAAGLPDEIRGQLTKMVRERMEAEKRIRDIRSKGIALQAWGVPNSISMKIHKSLRYSRLYRMNGMPTGLGMALHDAMEPLVKADPQFLSKVTQKQLHEAVQELHESLKYRMGPDVYDAGGSLKSKLRAGGGAQTGYDYPEWRQAFMERATKIFQEPAARGDKKAGLGLRGREEQPSEVLTDVLKDVVKQINELRPQLEKGEIGPEKVEPLMQVAIAMHAIMGLPVQSGPGQVGFISVAHQQLVPLMAELKKRKVSNRIITSVLRAYPLGESLLRLGIPRLWEEGLTGKGIKIAVLDNGIDWSHPEFKGMEPVSENFTRDRGEHTKGGHGTPMASIIRAILPDAEIHSYQIWSNTDLPGVRLTPQETEAATLKALDKIEASGIKIVNMSGGSAMDYSDSKVAERVNELSKKGIIFLVSAGNEGDDLPNGLQMRSPATAKGAISVHAVNYHGEEAEFSSSGRVFDPGTKSISDKYDIATFGVNVKAASQLPEPYYGMEPVPYDDVSGTSPAAPHAAGVVGLMYAAAAQAGIAVADSVALPIVRQSLQEAAVKAGKLPVLKSARKAINAFLRLLKAGQPTV